jgi:hypothetical protein
MNWIVTILIILCILCLFGKLTVTKNKVMIEGYNEYSGFNCPSCIGKTFNQCLRCFNCGWCVDKYGNSGCVGGDMKGPYNAEGCAKWYYIDPINFMTQRNSDYKCSYGPMASNRIY